MTDTPRDTRIETALTPEAWAGLFRESQGDDAWLQFPYDPDDAQEWYGKPHQLAAQMLYGQKFGFTSEDVEYLRGCMEMLKRHGDGRDAAFYNPHLASLANRIESLLPPE